MARPLPLRELTVDRPRPSVRLPLVGRGAELEALSAHLDRAEARRGGTLILCGASGVGKSRLLRACADEAARRGWQVAIGRGYPVESGVPYAPFGDALGPLIQALPPGSLTALARGDEADLGRLFPALGLPAPGLGSGPADPSELRTRLLWTVFRFLGRLAERHPVLLALDDLQWADASSLELLHFVARQIGTERIAVLCSYNEGQRDANPLLRTTEQSLVGLGVAAVREVRSLTHADTTEVVRQVTGADDATSRALGGQLYGWTRGNPFFVEETLKSLVESGRIRQSDGVWLGGDLRELALPRSIREAVAARTAVLSPAARAAAELLAVIGASTTFEELRATSGSPEAELAAAVEELRLRQIIEERLEGASVVYDFRHPLLRETMYAELGVTRARHLHGEVAASLEAHHGEAAMERADRLAYHYVRAMRHDLAPKAARYLARAGRDALAKFADREAADYLGAAVEQVGGVEAVRAADPELLHDLARARHRLGDFAGAIDLWEALRGDAVRAGDAGLIAALERRIGLALYRGGRYADAVERFERGLDAVRGQGAAAVESRLRLSIGECMMETGRPDEARRALLDALALAERSADPALQSRVHLALLLLHTWMGPPDTARGHGHRALAIAEDLHTPGLTCTIHWGLAVLAGLTGDAEAIRAHIESGEALADRISSPLHRLRIAEPAVEFMSNTGEWDAALALGERTISAARSLNQRALLSRLLVWTGLIHIGRGDVERGRRAVEEAWELSGADARDRPLDVHSVVPAHAGRAAYHVAIGDFDAAIRIGEEGLAIADRTGYTVWAIHRLLPILAEAYLSRGDVEGATRIGRRLRADSERMGHALGLAWADACDAFLIWLRGDISTGIEQLRAAAERLESIPVIPDAARLRRHFAARLRDHGARAEAVAELRHVHEIFVRLGAERELAKTRDQIRELGSRPPVRDAGAGAGALSGREAEIARLVAERKSNKTIGRLLSISPRTVSTHLSNIFRKLEVGSRAELGDVVRRLGLPEP